MGHATVLVGELSPFNCGGYVVNTFPSDSTKEDFIKNVDDHLDVLFG